MGPIGVFDSGYGGLTILEKFRKELPQYDYLYLGDNARTPYGTRSFDVVYQYTWECVRSLFDLGCVLVILACNTASAKALRVIQQQQLPHLDSEKKVLGVIRPTVECIGNLSQTKHVGLLATSGTVQSRAYDVELQHFFPDVVLTSEACPLWVPLIENDQHHTPGAEYFIRYHLDRLFHTDPKIDTLILGCTHYPLIQDQIEHFVAGNVRVVAQGDLVAKSLGAYLIRHPEIAQQCSKEGTCHYVTTESADKFVSSASVFLDGKIQAKHIDVG